jgi:hypothetical protein
MKIKAVSSDGKTLYLGLGFSRDPLQKNLVVIKLDNAGKPSPNPQCIVVDGVSTDSPLTRYV